MPRPAVFVFTQEGCGACHEFMPRFYQAVRRYPMYAFPVGIYDLARDRHGNHIATTLGVRATPTTVVMDSRGRLHKREGSITQHEVEQLLAKAV